MKKKYPKKIEIGGQDFKIKIYRKVPPSIEDELGWVAGWCDSAERVIGLIEPYIKEDNLTLFHEIGHASADVVKAENPLNNENFARPFFAVFYAALRDAGLIK